MNANVAFIAEYRKAVAAMRNVIASHGKDSDIQQVEDHVAKLMREAERRGIKPEELE